MKKKHTHSPKTVLIGSLLGAALLAACAASDATEPTDAQLLDEGAAELRTGVAEQALEALAPPICTQELATNMSAGGDYSVHPGGTMRLGVPGSYLIYWPSLAAEAGRYTLRVSARAHGTGIGFPSLRLWSPSGVIGQQSVTSWPDLQTYTFEYDHPAAGASLYFVLEYTGASESRDLIVEGMSVICPGVSCGDTVCTGGTLCCDGSELDQPICTLDSCFSGGVFGFTSPRLCDSHSDCGAGQLCGFTLQGNVGGGYTCLPTSSFESANPFPLRICASPGRSESCPSGQSCGAPDELGYAFCFPQ